MERYCPKCFKNFSKETKSCPDDGAILASFADQDLVGETLDDRYEIIGRVGKGGMGVVYKAVQPVIRRTVALKVLNKEIVKDQTALKRFLTEARAMASLKNAHTVTLYDFGATSTGLLYYTMELLEGMPLSRLIKKEGSLDYRRAAKLLLQACDSLEEAHDKDILHRDIKPDNLFVTREGKSNKEFLKVLDFGIAKLMGDSSLGTLTKTGMVCGTPAYLSPEQVMAQEVGPPADLYSLGIVFHEMLAGRPPFRAATTMKLLLKHLNETPQPVSENNPETEVPRAIEEFIQIALAKKPDDRFNSVPEFRRALHDALESHDQNPQTATLSPLGTTGEGIRVITDAYAAGREPKETAGTASGPVTGFDTTQDSALAIKTPDKMAKPAALTPDSAELLAKDLAAIERRRPSAKAVVALLGGLAVVVVVVLLVTQPWNGKRPEPAAEATQATAVAQTFDAGSPRDVRQDRSQEPAATEREPSDVVPAADIRGRDAPPPARDVPPAWVDAGTAVPAGSEVLSTDVQPQDVPTRDVKQELDLVAQAARLEQANRARQLEERRAKDKERLKRMQEERSAQFGKLERCRSDLQAVKRHLDAAARGCGHVDKWKKLVEKSSAEIDELDRACRDGLSDFKKSKPSALKKQVDSLCSQASSQKKKAFEIPAVCPIEKTDPKPPEDKPDNRLQPIG